MPTTSLLFRLVTGMLLPRMGQHCNVGIQNGRLDIFASQQRLHHLDKASHDLACHIIKFAL